MKEAGYFFAKIKSKIKSDGREEISKYFRKAGMKVGRNCNICCNIMVSEPYLVEIGDNVTFAGDVTLVTHDNSVGKLDLGGGKSIWEN